MVAETFRTPFNFTELSKAAFISQDPLGNHGGLGEGLKGMVRVGFDAGVKMIFEKFGVEEDKYDQVMNVAKTALSMVVEKGGVEAISVAAASLGFVMNKTSPWGLIIGTVVEVAGTIYTQTKGEVTIGDDSQTFMQGQWVAIDNGGKGQNVLTGEFAGVGSRRRGEGEEERRRLGLAPGSAPPFPTELAFESGFKVNHEISTGFYIGPGAERNMVTVFNFLTHKEEDVLRQDVRPVDASESAKLDGDKFASAIKTLRFTPEGEDETLFSNVCVDPGSEVVFEDYRYNVVKAVGRQVVIEDSSGRHSIVQVEDLTPGRSSRTTSYNYKADGTVASTFQSAGESSFYAGQYVWVPARPENETVTGRELVAISYIDPTGIVGYYALDGKRSVSQEDRTILIDDEFNATLAATEVFQMFREHAQAGYDLERIAPGNLEGNYFLLCIGVTGTETAKGRRKPQLTREHLVEDLSGDIKRLRERMAEKKIDIAKYGDDGLKEIVDIALETAEQLETVPQEMLDELFEIQDDLESSNGSLFPIAVGIGALLLLYNSIGF